MDEDKIEEVKESVRTFLVVLTSFFLKCWIVMLLWNWLMPAFGVEIQLDYWQAVALQVLCNYLFNSLGYGRERF